MYKKNAFIIGVITVIAAILYFGAVASFVYPGESARLMSLWQGLDVTIVKQYPLMEFFAKLFGASNILAPICGVVSSVLIYVVVSSFVRLRIGGEMMRPLAPNAAKFAGVTAALVYMFSPVAMSAATHLEPRLFDFTWLLIVGALIILLKNVGKGFKASLMMLLIAILTGLGATDSLLIIMFAPLMLFVIYKIASSEGYKPYLNWFIFVSVSIATFFVFLSNAGGGDIYESLRTLWTSTQGYIEPEGWMFVLFFSTLPFIIALFSSNKAYNLESGWAQWIFHFAMGFVSILAIATPLSAGSLMETWGILPVAATGFAAMTAGYLIAYWWLLANAKVRVNASHDDTPVAAKGRKFAWVAGPILAAVYVLNALFGIFTFDRNRGEFADKLADIVIDDLGERAWLISDGTLDEHIRLRAAQRGKIVNLICLDRDLDNEYLTQLSEKVRADKVGGEKSDELALSLSLGVLPFVQDWFQNDPEIANKAAIFGAPDLWYSAGIKPIPEFVFFGADPNRKVDWTRWREVDKLLYKPNNKWGSYRISKVKNPVDRMRLELRRHIGLIANNRGVFAQDTKDNAMAFDMYNLVLEDIDSDNVCSLFNIFEMARAKYPQAELKFHDYERRLKSIVDDPQRRYRLWALSNYYGYIRDPGIFIRLGYAWARSGRPGEALSQIRRAIDFIPTDRRSSIMNMMAALYASDNDRIKSREIYESILKEDAQNHDALIGMMRLSLVDGDEAKALEYLERATVASGDDPQAQIEKAMVALMKNDLAKARNVLEKVTRENVSDLRAWSLYAAVLMQQCDAEKDSKLKAKIEKELEEKVLPAMEKQVNGPFDYYVQTTRAFLLMRKGEAKRREARDAFIVAAKARPDITVTQDLVMGLDISLDDAVNAEAHAKDALRRDRKSPLGNYILGSLALRQGDYAAAESFLKKSADAPKPLAIAQNDLSEVLRRTGKMAMAEHYARLAVKTDPSLYVAWETLASALIEQNKDIAEAQQCVEKAIELSNVKGRMVDIRMLITLARLQNLNGDKKASRQSLRKVQRRLDELSTFERGQYEELVKDVR